MNERLRRFADEMPEELGGALITSPVNRRYFTGFPSSAGTLLLLRERAYLIVDSRYDEAARAAARGCEVILQEKLWEQVARLCKRHRVSALGVESETMSLKEYRRVCGELPGLSLLQDDWVSGQIERQRAIKDEREIGLIQRAQDIADAAFAHILGFIRPGRTEREIALELEFFSRRNGSEGAAFEFIAVSGKNSSRPHGVPTEKEIVRGDFVTLDFGATVEGYRSDMTRTVAVGEANDRQRAAYDTVLRAQRAALAALGPGKVCREIDKVARDIIERSPFRGCFGHGLGHGLGLEVHEQPTLNARCETVLAPGHVLSVEPGVYLPGEFGVRIEDIVAVRENGLHNFTESPKELLVL